MVGDMLHGKRIESRPRGFSGPFEWPAVVIGVAAAVALFRFRLGVIPVVLGAGLAGLVAFRFLAA